MGIANLIVVFLAIASIITFMTIYGTRAQWEKSSIGRNLMLFPITLLLLGVSGVMRRMDILSNVGQDIISIFAWSIVIALMVQRTRHVLRAQKRHEEQTTDSPE